MLVYSGAKPQIAFVDTSEYVFRPSSKRTDGPVFANYGVGLNIGRREYHPSGVQREPPRSMQADRNISQAQWNASRPAPGHNPETMQHMDQNKREAAAREQQRLDELQKGKKIERLQYRYWKGGDVYAPHDLSPEEQKKWKRRHSPSIDAFDFLGINPLHEYKVHRSSFQPL